MALTGSSTGRAAYIRTGFINVPGHTLTVLRVILETLAVPLTRWGAAQWSVRLRNEHGEYSVGVRLPDGIPASAGATPHGGDQTLIATQHFVFPTPFPTKSRGIIVGIDVSVGADLALQRAFVEVRTTPAQF